MINTTAPRPTIRPRTAIALRAFLYGAVFFGAATYYTGLDAGGKHLFYISLGMAGAGGLGAAVACFAAAALFGFYRNLLGPPGRG